MLRCRKTRRLRCQNAWGDVQQKGCARVREELSLFSAPHPLDHKAGFGELAFHSLRGELGTDLGEEVFTLIEADRDTGARERDFARCIRPEAHFDPLFVLVPEGDVPEMLRIEVAAELLVEHIQHVSVEVRRHACRIVVGRDEPVRCP
jgi:hypothetical protein